MELFKTKGNYDEGFGRERKTKSSTPIVKKPDTPTEVPATDPAQAVKIPSSYSPLTFTPHKSRHKFNNALIPLLGGVICWLPKAAWRNQEHSPSK